MRPHQSLKTSAPRPRLVLLFTLMMLLTAFLKQPGAETTTVRVCCGPGLPIAAASPEGAGSGIFVDILDYIAGKENWSLAYRSCLLPQGFEMIDSDSIDIIAGVALTAQRNEKLDFNNSAIISDWGQIYVRVGGSIDSILELDRKTVALLKGDAHGHALRDLCARFGINPIFVELEDPETLFDFIRQGQADAGVASRLFGLKHQGGFTVRGTQIVFNPIEIRYAVAKGRNGHLLQAIDKHMAKLSSDPNSPYHESINHWLGKERPEEQSSWPFWFLCGAIAAVFLVAGYNSVLRSRVRKHTEVLERQIEDRKRIQAELALSEQKYRELVESANSVIVKITLDGRITFMNECAERLFGYSREEIINRPAIGTIVPEVESSGRDMSALLNSIVLDQHRFATIENENITKDGTRLWMSWTNRGVYDDRGNLEGIVSIGVDQTSRKKAERELLITREKLSAAFRLSPVMLVLSDICSGLLEVNDAFLQTTGYTAGEIIGRTSLELGLWDDPAKYRQMMGDIRSHGECIGLETLLRCRDGSLRDVRISSRTIEFSGLSHILTVVEDTTEIKRKEEFFRTIFMESPLIIALNEMEGGTFVDINPTYCEFGGMSKEMVIGKRPDDLNPLEDRSEHARLADLLKRQGRIDMEEMQIRDRRGNMRTVLLTTRLIQISGKSHALSILQDISERKQIENAYRQSEEKYAKTFAANPAGIALSRLSDGFILEANYELHKMFGFNPPEMLALTAGEIGIWADSKDRELMLERIGETGSVRDLELWGRTKTGERILCRFSGELIEIDNEPCLISALVDITRSKQAEDALRKSEENYRMAVSSISSCVWKLEFDQKHRITGCYISEVGDHLLGLPEGTLRHNFDTYMQFVHPDDRSSIWQCLECGMADPGPQRNMEFRARRPDGQWIWLRSAGITRVNPDSTFRTYGTTEDITERKSAEESLRKSEAFMRSLLEATPAGVCTLVDRVVQTANRAFCKITGYDLEEVIGRSTRMFYPDDVEHGRMGGILYGQVDSEGFGAAEGRLRRKDGAIIDVWFCLSPLDPRNPAAGVTSTMLDITDLNRTKKALEESEKRFRLLFESAGLAIVIIKEGRFFECNDQGLALFGVTREQIIGKDLKSFSPELQPDGSVSESHERTLIEASMRGIPQFFEWRFMRPDGTTFDVEVTLARVDIQDEAYLQAIVRDITRRKITEEELWRRSIAIEQAAEEVMITDPEAVIQYVNPSFERITGYSREEAIGKTPRILNSGFHDAAFYGDLWKTVKGGKVWTGRFINKRKDGRLIHEDATISPLVNPSGQVTGYVSLKRDVTEQIMLETQLRRTQNLEAIGTLAGGIAHDFNNILSAIIGYSEILKYLRIPQDSPAQPDLDQITKAAYRARDLVKQILTFSRQAEEEKKPVLLLPIVKEAIKFLRASLPVTIEIRQRLKSKGGMVHADPTQMHQIIMNFCTNAAHSMRDLGGVLRIELEDLYLGPGIAEASLNLPSGAYVRLTVSDTGHGMTQEVMQRIFDPYFTTKAPGEGTGLGLSVVHGIVKSHGGTILVRSEPGKGSTFQAFLPILIDANPDETEETTAVLPRGNARILFVDDEEAIAAFAGEALGKLGYDIVTATSGVEAMRLIESDPNRFDLIMTDFTMPQMTGLVFAEKVLAIRPDIPIVMYSGAIERDLLERAKELGIKEFVPKPLGVRELVDSVRKALEGKR
ncbi:MAG: PAS domain S-box protein [Desulfobacteraceae bacterium]|nr:PAS domain S-box protein [Desulfobacteraceae bacterium]